MRAAIRPQARSACSTARATSVPDETPSLSARELSGEGFGLFIVERLTRRWGIARQDRNTRVWFEFSARR